MHLGNEKVTVLIPIHNEEGNVLNLTTQLANVLEKSNYEIIFIDDGSTDNTLHTLKELNAQNNKVNYLSFSRNFGHQSALRAGYHYASGDCVICMDGDLQHPPELIPKMIEKWKEGYDIVNTIRKDSKQTSFFKRMTASFFYTLINKLSDVKIEKGSADFRLVDKSIVEILRNFQESSLFYRGIISWLGFKQYSFEYFPDERKWGKTKYSVSKMFKFAMSGITGFSIKPLQLSAIVGLIVAILSFLYGLYAIYIKLFQNNTIPGWTSTLIVISFIGGLQLIMIGILGEYIGKLFLESKRRPEYIIREKSL
jgi:polyisoprenyl-phosphate glycosyltransferase